MKKLIGLAILPLLAGVALAQQPVPLTSQQMDKVTAGHLEVDVTNTSLTIIDVFQRSYLTEPTGNSINCPSCYLLIITPTISIASQFGR